MSLEMQMRVHVYILRVVIGRMLGMSMGIAPGRPGRHGVRSPSSRPAFDNVCSIKGGVMAEGLLESFGKVEGIVVAGFPGDF